MNVFNIDNLMNEIMNNLVMMSAMSMMTTINIMSNPKSNLEGIIKLVGKDIQILSCVSTSFLRFFSDEQRAKNILNQLISSTKLRINEITNLLNDKGGIYHKIENKINHLFDVVIDPIKNFSDRDLSDSWYMNHVLAMSNDELKKRLLLYKQPSESVVRMIFLFDYNEPQTLLTIAFKTRNLHKIQQLLTSGIKLDNVNEKLLLKITIKRVNLRLKKKHIDNRTYYFTLAQLLLEYGMKINIDCLVYAVKYDDEEYAYLLLKYGADPYQKTFVSNRSLMFPLSNKSKGVARNIFDICPGKQWFIDMIRHMSVL